MTSNATSTWDSNWCAVKCDVTSTIGSKVVRQTKLVMRYVPGRPAEASIAFRFGSAVPGIRKRIGQFDSENGFYLEQGVDGKMYCVLRSKTSGSVVETRVEQSNWNIDKLNGFGKSGLTLDMTKIQLLVVDYEWYGAGVVKFGFVINDEIFYVHVFYVANSLNTPWASTPFIPMRTELENVSSTSSDYMYLLSQCHSQEGSSDNLGYPLSISSPFAGYNMLTSGTFYPVISIRLKSTRLNAVVIPLEMKASTLDNTFVFYRLVLNATLTGPVWTDYSTESSVQYDQSSTSMSGGTISNQGFASGGTSDGLILNINQESGNYQLGRSSMGIVSDTLTIAMTAVNANKTAIATLNWIEQR